MERFYIYVCFFLITMDTLRIFLFYFNNLLCTTLPFKLIYEYINHSELAYKTRESALEKTFCEHVRYLKSLMDIGCDHKTFVKITLDKMSVNFNMLGSIMYWINDNALANLLSQYN